MIKLRLLKLTDEYVQYKFFPEGDMNDFGIVQVSLKNCLERFIVKKAKNSLSMYELHAMAHVSNFVKNDNFPETSAREWY